MSEIEYKTEINSMMELPIAYQRAVEKAESNGFTYCNIKLDFIEYYNSYRGNEYTVNFIITEK